MRILALTIAAITGCTSSAASLYDPAPPNEVRLTTDAVTRAGIVIGNVAEQPLARVLQSSGRVSFDDARVAHVFSPVAGRITRIVAKLGDHVKKGAPLAVIESPDIGSASSDVGKAKADLVAAEHNYERQQRLFANHAASELDLETAEDNYRKAKAELARASERMRLMHGGLDDVTQGYTLRSPLDGDVIARAASPGMEVSGQYATGGNNELFTVGILDRVWVLADVYEVDLGRVRVGAAVRVGVVAYPERVFSGTVDWVASALDPTLRTARVRCVLDNADHALKPEMYATVRIETEHKVALAVARNALFRMGEQTFVFIVRPDGGDRLVRFARVPVAADEGQAAGPIEVRRGLQAGQRVVVGGVAQLRGLLDNGGGEGGR